MKHIILDTDIGRNPDDLFALLLGLYSKDIKIDLVVTSDEHVNHRALFVQGFSELIGAKINVVAGKDLGNKDDCFVCDLVQEDNKVNTDTSEAIANIVNSYESISYVCIGPLSNLSKFIIDYPLLAKKLNVTIMGGKLNLNPGRADRNIRQDLESAKNVFNSKLNMRFVIADTTFNDSIKLDMSSELYTYLFEVDNIKTRLIINGVNNFIEKTGRTPYLHDPVTLASIIDQNVIQFEEKQILMLDNGEFKEDSNGKTISVSKSADFKLFNALMMNALKQKFKIKEKKEIDDEDELEE